MSTKIKTAEELFGSTKRINATGGHKVNSLDLAKPLEWEQGFMRLFCEGCGNLVEINRQFAEAIFRLLARKMPDNPQEFYFQSKRCGYCDGQDNAIKLFAIPRVNA